LASIVGGMAVTAETSHDSLARAEKLAVAVVVMAAFASLLPICERLAETQPTFVMGPVRWVNERYPGLRDENIYASTGDSLTATGTAIGYCFGFAAALAFPIFGFARRRASDRYIRRMIARNADDPTASPAVGATAFGWGTIMVLAAGAVAFTIVPDPATEVDPALERVVGTGIDLVLPILALGLLTAISAWRHRLRYEMPKLKAANLHVSMPRPKPDYPRAGLSNNLRGLAIAVGVDTAILAGRVVEAKLLGDDLPSDQVAGAWFAGLLGPPVATLSFALVLAPFAWMRRLMREALSYRDSQIAIHAFLLGLVALLFGWEIVSGVCLLLGLVIVTVTGLHLYDMGETQPWLGIAFILFVDGYLIVMVNPTAEGDPSAPETFAGWAGIAIAGVAACFEIRDRWRARYSEREPETTAS